jgi:hypothetical protein
LYASSEKSLDRALQCFDRITSQLTETDGVAVDAELFAEMGSALVAKDPTRALRGKYQYITDGYTSQKH